MAQYRTFTVTEILESHKGVIKARLNDGSRAYAFTDMIGEVSSGDDVVVNTTAVDLALGTGGWHFVLWNLSRSELDTPRGGHIMKARYTPVQIDSGVAEEFDSYPKDRTSIDGMPVIAAPLHSHIPAIAALLKNANPNLSVAVAISDGAALPIALSDLLRTLQARSLINTTISFGHSFGGDYEAINIYTALLTAKHVASADVVIATMGPGIVGTNSPFGFTGIEVAHHLDAASALSGNTFGVLRCSAADPRTRHQGISHHSLTTFGIATHDSHKLGYITDHELSSTMKSQLDDAGIFERHDVEELTSSNIVSIMEAYDLSIYSMGRPARDDELFFEAAAAPAQRLIKEGI